MRPSGVRILGLAAATLLVGVWSLETTDPLAAQAPAAGGAPAAEWSRFRGPNGSGVAEGGSVPVEFGPDRGVAWAAAVPAGRSSPVVAGGLVVVTGIEDGMLVTLALDRASGATAWRQAVPPLRDEEIYQGNDAATPTPASDGSSVYVFFSELGVISYDLEGRERWRHELGPFDNFYGIAASPILAGDLLLVLCDQVDGSHLLALDTATGEPRWRAERAGRIESWATPVLYPADGPPVDVIVFGHGWVDAYDVATGAHRWEMPGVGPGPVASPVVSGSMLVVTTPAGGGAPLPPFDQLLGSHDGDGDARLSETEFAGVPGMAEHFRWADRDGDGGVTGEEFAAAAAFYASPHFGAMGIALPAPGARTPARVVWSNRQSTPYIATPLVDDDIVYLVHDGGIVQSLDLASGELFKRARTSRSAGPVFASPVAAEGRIVVASVGGEVAVVRAGVDWEVLAVNEFDEPIYATPALVGDRLFVRTPSRLYAFDAR